MKNLTEIIENLPGQGVQPGPIFAKRRLDEAIEYFDGIENVPAKLYLQACKNPLRVDLIKENLKTHDWKTMGRKLKEKFPQLSTIDLYPVGEKKKFCRITSNPLTLDYVPVQDIVDNPEFKKIVEFFNYGISRIRGNIIDLEPIYPDSAEDFVNNVCFNKVYHITVGHHAKSVEISGLRCKTGEKGNKYREFPKRIYVIGFDVKKYSKEEIIRICTEISREYLGTGKPVIFECGPVLGEYFYEDTVMPLEYGGVKAMFCYVNIPPEKLKRIN